MQSVPQKAQIVPVKKFTLESFMGGYVKIFESTVFDTDKIAKG